MQLLTNQTSSLLQIDHKSGSVPDSGYGSSSAGHEGKQDLMDDYGKSSPKRRLKVRLISEQEILVVFRSMIQIIN